MAAELLVARHYGVALVFITPLALLLTQVAAPVEEQAPHRPRSFACRGSPGRGAQLCMYQLEVRMTLAMAVSMGWGLYLAALAVLGWLILRHNR